MSAQPDWRSSAIAAYRAGCSIAYIAADLRRSKADIRAALADAGVAIRKLGFAVMKPELRTAIASAGGASLRPEQRAYFQDRNLASVAGRSGGVSLHHGSGTAPHPRVSRTSARIASKKEK